jgi:hypothetical protein
MARFAWEGARMLGAKARCCCRPTARGSRGSLGRPCVQRRRVSIEHLSLVLLSPLSPHWARRLMHRGTCRLCRGQACVCYVLCVMCSACLQTRADYDHTTDKAWRPFIHLLSLLAPETGVNCVRGVRTWISKASSSSVLFVRAGSRAAARLRDVLQTANYLLGSLLAWLVFGWVCVCTSERGARSERWHACRGWRTSIVNFAHTSRRGWLAQQVSVISACGVWSRLNFDCVTAVTFFQRDPRTEFY